MNTLNSIVSAYVSGLDVDHPVRRSWERGELTPMRDHLAEPVAWQDTTQTVTTPNPFAAGEIYLQSLWDTVGGNITNSFEANSALLKNAVTAAMQANDIARVLQLQGLAIEILSIYTKLKVEGCAFTGVAETTETVTIRTPTRYRWQDVGLGRAPNNNDLECL